MGINRSNVAAQIMEHLCTCPSHGYSQPGRYGTSGYCEVPTDAGTIKVKCGGITRTCTITQDKPLLIGGKTSMSRTYDADEQADCCFTVTCSQSPWTAVSSASWVTIYSDCESGIGTAKLYYYVAANMSASSRTATIKVTSRGLTRTCTIKQNGK